MGWIHNSHFTDNKLNDKCINDITVDIGQNKDWSISDNLEDSQITTEGNVYLDAITGQYYNDNIIHKSKTRIEIPKQKDGSKYSLKNLSKQQQAVVIASIDTIGNSSKTTTKKTIASNCYGMWRNWKIIHHQYNHFHCEKYGTNE